MCTVQSFVHLFNLLFFLFNYSFGNSIVHLFILLFIVSFIHCFLQGDSGGPLVCGNGAGGFDVIGIVSFGPGECNGQPGVFTEVSKFNSWIEQRTGEWNCEWNCVMC